MIIVLKKGKNTFSLFTLLRVGGSSHAKTSGCTGKEPEMNSDSKETPPYDFLLKAPLIPPPPPLACPPVWDSLSTQACR